MNNRLKDKVIEIEQFIEELEPLLPSNLNEYKKDYKIRAIGERYFEKIIEAVIDIAFIIIKNENLKQPDYEKESFDILASSNILSKELSEKLKEAKGMRNIISHEYGKIDNELVFEAITEQLIPDVRKFIKEIGRYISHG